MNNKYFLLLALGFVLTASAASNSDLIEKKKDYINLNKKAVTHFLTEAKKIKKTMDKTPQKLIYNLSLNNQIKYETIKELMNNTIINTQQLLKKHKNNIISREALLQWAKHCFYEWSNVTGIRNERSTTRGMEKWSANPIMRELEILHYAWSSAPKHQLSP